MKDLGYTRSASWADAWRLQTEPLAEDLAEIDVLAEGIEPQLKGRFAALDSYREKASVQLEKLGVQLRADSITVDEALEQLAALRAELTAKLDAFAQAQIEAYAQSEEEKDEMRAQMQDSRNNASGQAPRAGTILDVLHPVSAYWRVSSYYHGYSAGVSAVTASREAASSSGGISSGYSGGGSFSGAGGSSRF